MLIYNTNFSYIYCTNRPYKTIIHPKNVVQLCMNGGIMILKAIQYLKRPRKGNRVCVILFTGAIGTTYYCIIELPIPKGRDS